jgi:hypothetical protein
MGERNSAPSIAPLFLVFTVTAITVAILVTEQTLLAKLGWSRATTGHLLWWYSEKQRYSEGQRTAR